MNKEKLQQLGHLVAGLIIMVHGFDSFERGEFKSAAGYLGVAIIFMLLAAWHKSITQQFLQGDVAFFLLEGVIMLYSGWDYSTRGNKFLYFGMAAAGCLYLVFAFFSITVNDDKPRRRKSSRKKRRKSSSASVRDDKYSGGGRDERVGNESSN